MTASAIYLVTDEKLAPIAGMQAKRIAALWACDVHVFVERKDRTAQIREFGRDEGVIYHYDELMGFLPEGLPEDRKWPRIVYLRLFVPQLLRSYRKLLYMDADIWAMRAEPRIWDIDLPAGIGAVSDIATLNKAPYDIKNMSRDQWLESIGVRSGRYLNSGVLLIDVEKWLQIDFAQALRRYFAAYPAAARFDQDFLAHHFDGCWTELSPRMNYQAFVLELGLTEAIAPVFVHFCRTQKPWYGDAKGWRAPTDSRYTKLYHKLMQDEGEDHASYLRPNPVNPTRRARYWLRAWMRRRFGYVSGRERRDLADWQRRSDEFLQFMSAGLSAGRFADETRQGLDLPRSNPVFDGRFVVAEENRMSQ